MDVSSYARKTQNSFNYYSNIFLLKNSVFIKSKIYHKY